MLASRIVLKRCLVKRTAIRCIRYISTDSEANPLEHERRRLFTPGPLGVSLSTKQSMLRDVGSRDSDFMKIIRDLRNEIVNLAGVSQDQFTCVPMQGSGTFAIEAVLSTAAPICGKVLILENGAYGKRQAKICQTLNIPYHMESFPENKMIDIAPVREFLTSGNYSFVSIVHCETSSGVINPISEIGLEVKRIKPDAIYFVDAMSSFGAIPIDMQKSCIHFMVSSANKCLEGVPGFSYAICKTENLLANKGRAKSYVLDLVDQYEVLESTGQFRFTPPTHAMLAFNKALEELRNEGGVNGRCQRYKENREVLRRGMKKLGFTEFLDEKNAGYIITSYRFPEHSTFDFDTFYKKLSAKGQVIYPGKVLDADCFRIGNIGHLFPSDMERLLHCIKDVCQEMGMPVP